jgi:hypothetical protein
MKVVSKTVHPYLRDFRKLPVDFSQPHIRNLAGNYDAKLLFLCEELTLSEYESGVPLSDANEHRVYCSLLSSAGFDLHEDFLVVPFMRFGKKPRKDSTMGIKDYVCSLFATGQFRACICMGISPFAFTFAGGRKTHARSIIGNLMFMPELGSRPVYVLPGSAFLCPNESVWREVSYAKEVAQNIVARAEKLKELLNTRIA